MSRLYRLAALALVVGYALAVFGRARQSPDDRSTPEEQWKRVQEAEDKRLPKTALERLDPIIDRALRARAYPEAVKALAKKVML